MNKRSGRKAQYGAREHAQVGQTLSERIDVSVSHPWLGQKVLVEKHGGEAVHVLELLQGQETHRDCYETLGAVDRQDSLLHRPVRGDCRERLVEHQLVAATDNHPGRFWRSGGSVSVGAVPLLDIVGFIQVEGHRGGCRWGGHLISTVGWRRCGAGSCRRSFRGWWRSNRAPTHLPGVKHPGQASGT